MKDLKAYLISKTFRKNILLAVGILVALLIFALLIMRIYTMHNRSVAVPDYTDLPVEDVAKYSKQRKLEYELFDSLFVAEKEPGVVIDQHPKAGSLVKKRRKVYLTINANTPGKIPMPDLVGITLREARTKITVAGLELGSLSYRYDMAKNEVLEQLIQGKIIEAGDTVLKGSAVDLVLGKGLGNESANVPDLIGLSYEEARNKAAEAFFATSSPIPDNSIVEKDTLVPFVYRQHPVHSRGSLARLGTQITIWVTLDSTKLSEHTEGDSTDLAFPEPKELEDVENTEDDPYYNDSPY
jgi:eukaryotic-like serine/threonine-protein kinase